jgi:hypothetical protein
MRFRRVLFALLLEEELHICDDQCEGKSLHGSPPSSRPEDEVVGKAAGHDFCRLIVFGWEQSKFVPSAKLI